MDLEEKLFGFKRANEHPNRITDQTWIPLKTGIPGSKFLKHSPHHIMDAEEQEPLYAPQENILEDCLRREAERAGYNESLINRVVYEQVEEPVEPDPQADSDKPPSLPSPNNCDNDQDFPPYYSLKSDEDTTLVFESRFESANLRKVIQIYDYEYDLILKPDYLTKGYT